MHDSHTELYLRDGFVVLPQRLRRDQLLPLLAACDHVLSQVRAASTGAGRRSTRAQTTESVRDGGAYEGPGEY
jgi:hypothetical protein